MGIAMLDRDPLAGLDPIERKSAEHVLVGLVEWSDTTVWDGDDSVGSLPVDYIASRIPWDCRGEVLRHVLQSLLNRGLLHHEFDRERDTRFRWWITERGVEVAASFG